MSSIDYDKMIQYLEGELSAEEKQSFEQQLELNPEWRDEMQIYLDLNQALRRKLYPDENELSLRNTLTDLRGQYFKEGAKVVPFRKYNWAVPAAAAMILLAVLLIWLPWRKDVYQQYAAIEMPGVVQRGTTTDSLMSIARNQFNTKKFDQAVPLFESILKQDTANAFARFYYAIALLQTGQTIKSREELSQLFAGNSIFKYNASFYIALSYLKENDKESSRQWLERIPPESDIYPKALELRRRL